MQNCRTGKGCDKEGAPHSRADAPCVASYHVAMKDRKEQWAGSQGNRKPERKVL